MNLQLFRRSLTFSLLCLLAACASSPPEQPVAQPYASIGVLTLVDERAQVIRTGITVFGNDFRVLDMGGRANFEATKYLIGLIKAAQPGAKVVALDADRQRLLDGIRKNSFFSGGAEAISTEIATIARSAGVDVVFVLTPFNYDNTRVRGLGVEVRPFLNQASNVDLVATYWLYVLNAGGQTVSRAPPGDSYRSTVAAEKLALTPDLASLDQAQVADGIRSALLEQLRTTLRASMVRLGYAK